MLFRAITGSFLRIFKGITYNYSSLWYHRFFPPEWIGKIYGILIVEILIPSVFARTNYKNIGGSIKPNILDLLFPCIQGGIIMKPKLHVCKLNNSEPAKITHTQSIKSIFFCANECTRYILLHMIFKSTIWGGKSWYFIW